MKKNLVIFISLFISFISAQEENKFRLRSLDFGFGKFQTAAIVLKKDQNKSGIDGFSGIISITGSISKNLVAASVIGGAEFCILCGEPSRFKEFRAQYGREFKPSEKVVLDIFGGLAYYSLYRSGQNSFAASSLSLPLSANMKFYFRSNFGMGVNMNYSINQINSNFSMNLLFTLKFEHFYF